MFKKTLQISLSVLAVGFIVGYAYFAFRGYIHGPEIIIYEPINGSIISTSTIVIKGQALRVQEIVLSGRPIFIDEKGNFTETLLLFPGYNVSLIKATDKFGRIIEYKLELVYKE
ncbi:MAG TPA: hypothetical protein VJI66_00820 [Candidatus Paceibacterota bacterium]